MNRTKRKIFEISMNLFATKGYDATSIEEITSVVGVAKGTLYYHFSSKEEIFNFLIEEGMKLLQNSMSIKVASCNTLLDKLKAILLIQIKVMVKYQDFMTIVLSEVLGKESRNLTCRKYVFEYIDMLENIINESIKNRRIY
ncbi:MAG: TetR/AcrR family transcriptional regulator [Clostridia bacterium]|nr:TetR/AcrR family transcriptional regulator [Clostridia bacterium]